MEKSFSFYFSKSKDLSKFAFKKLGFITRLELFVYMILSFLGKWFFFSRPIFAVVDDNIGAMISETHTLCFSKAFEGVPEKYLKLMLTYLVEDLMTGAFLTVFFLPLYFACKTHPYEMIIHIVSTAVLGLAVLFVMIKRIKYTMIGFVAAYDNNLSMGDYFYNCKKASGKAAGNIVKNEIVYFLIFHLIPVALMVYCFRYLYIHQGIFWTVADLYVGVGALFLCFIFYAFFIEKFALVKYTVDHLNAEDACIKKKCLVAKRVPSSKDEFAAVFANNKADFEKLDITKEGK